jgi:hypothetical protein
MNTLRTKIEPRANKTLWILSYLVALVGLFFSFINLSEFYNLRFGGQGSEYPFGSINDNPWYYQSATLYTKYCLVCGLLFSITTIVTFLAILKKNKRLLVIGVCLTSLFLFANMISTATQ